MTPRTYASPEAFKQALEQRLRSSARTGAEFARQRQLLEGRARARAVLERARTTKAVDLRRVGLQDDVLAKLQEVGRKDLGDFMAFEERCRHLLR